MGDSHAVSSGPVGYSPAVQKWRKAPSGFRSPFPSRTGARTRRPNLSRRKDLFVVASRFFWFGCRSGRGGDGLADESGKTCGVDLSKSRIQKLLYPEVPAISARPDSDNSGIACAPARNRSTVGFGNRKRVVVAPTRLTTITKPPAPAPSPSRTKTAGGAATAARRGRRPDPSRHPSRRRRAHR